MFGFSFGLVVEGLVAILLALTIGYCVVLNRRLKRLHADRDTLRLMVQDLVQATTLANSAIQELKSTAVEADSALNARLDEAERFGIQLAGHVNAGHAVIDKIARITAAARQPQLVAANEPKTEVEAEPVPVMEVGKVKSALLRLAERAKARGEAA